MIWTKELIEELRALAGVGHTSGQIAIVMDITRNAVIGKLNREGIPLLRVPKWGPRATLEPRKTRKSKLKPKIAKPMGPPLRGRMGAGPAVLAITPNQCEWPIGDPASEDFHFCSEPRDPLVEPPYCRKHVEIAIRKR